MKIFVLNEGFSAPVRKPLNEMKSRLSLVLVVPFLLSLEGSKASEHDFSRRLGGDLNITCPVDDLNDAGNEENYAGLLDSYVTFGTSIVERMRAKPESYYEDLVNRFVKFACDEADRVRCVDENSLLAARDWSGDNCIRAANYECPVGTCERASNCYWNSVYEGQNRTTRFSANEYEEAATGEMHFLFFMTYRRVLSDATLT